MTNQHKNEALRGKNLTFPVNIMKLSMEWAISKTKLGNKCFFDPKDFDWVPGVESQWKNCLKELQLLMQELNAIPSFETVFPRNSTLGLKDNWKTFFFYAYGHEYEDNCKVCPETVKTLQKIPGMKTAFFSILAPGQKIPPHYGPYKGVLRFHLPLIVPEDEKKLGIRVGNKVEHWVEGKGLIFDDSFEHEAWNLSDQHRVVLFIDFLRPLPLFLDLSNRLFVWMISKSKTVNESETNIRKWTDKHGKLIGAGTN